MITKILFVIILNTFIIKNNSNYFQYKIGGHMIEVVGINGETFLINATLIEKIEFIPETKITLTTGKYYLVKDKKEEVIDKIIKYNQKIIRGVTAE